MNGKTDQYPGSTTTVVDADVPTFEVTEDGEPPVGSGLYDEGLRFGSKTTFWVWDALY
jgi:hypothetical protein